MIKHLVALALRGKVVAATAKTLILTLESAAMAACGRKVLAMWSNCLNKNVTKREKSII